MRQYFKDFFSTLIDIFKSYPCLIAEEIKKLFEV